MIKKVKRGEFLATAWGSRDYNEVADFVNGAEGGDGVTVKRGKNGGLQINLGDGSFQFRHVTIVDQTTTGDGRNALAFRRVCVLCTTPSDPFATIPLPNTEAEEGWSVTPEFNSYDELLSLTFTQGETVKVVDVEPCDE